MPETSTIEVNLASHQAGAEKRIQADVQRRIEQRHVELTPRLRATTRFGKIAEVLRRPFGKDFWKAAVFKQTEEYHRLQWGNEEYSNLKKANLGEGGLSAEAVTLAQAKLREVRQAGRQSLESAKTLQSSDVKLSGQEQSAELTGASRDFAISLLKDVKQKLQSGENDETIETFIQNKLAEYTASPAGQTDTQIRAFFGKNRTRYGSKSEFYSTDFIDVARSLNHLDLVSGSLDNRIKINLHKTLQGTQSEVNYTLAEKFYARLKESKFNRLTGGLIINTATIGITTSAATYLSRSALRMGVTLSHIATPLVGIATSAVYKYIQERYTFTQESGAVARDIEANLLTNPDAHSPRRKELEKIIMPMFAKESELINGGGIDVLNGQRRKAIDELLSSKLRVAAGDTAQDIDQVRQNIHGLKSRYAEMKARLSIPIASEQKQSLLNQFGRSLLSEATGKGVFREIGLISYDMGDSVDHERLNYIRQMLEIQHKLQDLGEDPNDLLGAVTNKIIQTRDQQEEKFNWERQKRALAQAGKAAVIGGTLGLASQEGLALAARTLPSIHETQIVGSFFNKGQTNLEKGVHLVTGKVGHPEVAAPPLSENTLKDLYQQGGTAELGNHLRVAVQPGGSASIIDETTQQPVSDLGKVTLDARGHFQVEGNIPGNIQQTLNQDGFIIQHSGDIPQPANSILEPDKTITVNTTGHNTVIPDGTEWLRDPAHPNGWDLVVKGHADKILVGNAQFNADGQMVSYDSSHSLVSSEGIHQTLTDTGGGFHMESKPVHGPSGEWAKHATSVQKEYYAYNSPVSVQNELRLHTFHNDDAVTLNMNQMEISRESELVPPYVDVQQAIKEGKAAFAFALPNDENHPIIIGAKSFGFINGELKLNPTDTDPTHLMYDPDGHVIMQAGQFAQMVTNHSAYASLPNGDIATELNNRLNVWNLGDGKGHFGTIGAGEMVESNGVKTFKQFAAIRGIGYQESSNVQVPNPVTHIYDTVVTLAQPITEPIPPIPTYNIIPPVTPEAPPMIPIPFAPRHPLEGLVTPPPLTPAYPYPDVFYGEYGAFNPDDTTFYRDRFSNRLRDDPNARLDAREISDYFTRQDADYMRQLESFLLQPDMQEGMDEQCDAVVCIPAFTLGEGRNIQGTLEHYLLQVDQTRNKQAIDPRKFEIIIFLNHPKNPLTGGNPQASRLGLEQHLGHPYTDGAEARVRAGNPEAYDTEEVIKQFKQTHPELRIRVMTHEFDQRPNWGRIIKPLYDAALLRSSRRANAGEKDPVIITNDADLVDMSPTYMRDILQFMDLNEIASARNNKVKKIDGIVGKIDMPNQGYEQTPGFLLAERLYQFFDAENRKRPGRNVITQGRSTILRGSTYAAIGGVDERRDAGADTLLGKVVALGRNDPKTIKYFNRAWLQSDARRELDAWKRGIPLAYAWNEWAAMNLYGPNWKDQFNTPPQDPTQIDKETLQREINTELQRWNITGDSPEVKRALMWLGFKHGDWHSISTTMVDGAGNNRTIQGIAIDKLDNVVSHTQAYIRERRWEASQRKKTKSLAENPAANIAGTPYYARYLNYEEFDRVSSDIFGTEPDNSDGEYPWTASRPDPTIIDLGGHIGLSTLYWKHKAPDAKITVVEPNSETFGALQENIGRNHLTNVTSIHAAATSKNTPVTLYKPKPGVDFHWGDFVAGVPQDPTKYDTETVPPVHLSALITNPIDLLKIDIEGSELEVLKEAEAKLPMVKEVIMEFHSDPANPSNSLREALELLTRQGYHIEIRQWNKTIDPATLNLIDKIFLTVLAKRP